MACTVQPAMAQEIKTVVEKTVNDELKIALTDMVNKVVVVTGQATDFLVAEIPDVIQQLLMWKMVESLVFSTLGLILICIPLLVWKFYCGVGKIVEPETKETYARYVPTLTHDSRGDIHAGVVFFVFSSLCLVLVCCSIFNLDWLQILISPKVYLIEYATNIVK